MGNYFNAKVFAVLVVVIAIYWSATNLAEFESPTAPPHIWRIGPNVSNHAYLSHGWTHYHVKPGTNGECVVLLHGMLGTGSVWEPPAARLNEAGFTVVYYDIYGHGLSSSQKAEYNVQFFVSQLFQLIHAVPECSAPVHLAGGSMGGSIVAGFAERFPNLTRSLTLLVPAGIAVQKPFLAKLLSMPLVGEIMIGNFGELLLKDLVRRWHKYEDFRQRDTLPASRDLPKEGRLSAGFVIISTLFSFGFVC